MVGKYEDKRVLVVEDDGEIRDILKSFLSDMGIQSIFEAENGLDAIDFIDSNPCGADLVICDWNMPGMSGYSVYHRFRITHPKTPFIMVTSRNDYESVKLAKKAGMERYLLKPLKIDQFQQKVASAFNA